MADHPNVIAVRKGWEALIESGDPMPLYELSAPDAVLHMCPGQSWLSGSHRGRDTGFGLLMQSMQVTGNTMKATLHDVVGNDDHVVALLHFSFEHEGKTLQGNESWVSHMEDGLMTETWVFIWDQDDANEFWSKARPE